MKLNIRISSGLVLAGLLLLFAVSACNYPTQTPPTSTPDILPTLVATLLATPEATPTQVKPERLLTVCLGEEPASLFPYGDASQAARAVREAIYDSPVDWVNYAPQPGILKKIPSLADGDVRLEPVAVSPGDLILDAKGQITTLQAGSSYHPTGCRDTGCAVTYSGSEPIQMDQLAVRFTLEDGLVWSDNNPLVAQDSVFSYEIAQRLFPRVQAELMKATASYQAVDERSVEWRGLPGYIDPVYADNFFLPLPQHAWGDLPVGDMATAEISSRMPIGWGPYIIEEWKAGDHFTLRKNENYFRSAEGLPVFDRLVFRFVGASPEGMAALLAGECDILTETALRGASQEELSELQDAGRIKIAEEPDTGWEQLIFNTQPIDATQPAFLQTREVRQSIAQCIDRQALRASLGLAQQEDMDSYVQTNHPLFNPESRQSIYNPQAAGQGLQAAGWLDADNDPATPRVATGVAGVPDGTLLTLELLSLQDDAHQLVAEAVKDNLAQCGVLVNIRYLTPEELFAPGPGGPIFGRNFQLALLGWDFSLEPACYLYTTEEIPGSPPGAYKGWGGANAAGFSNTEFDQACEQAKMSLPDDPRGIEAHKRAQAIFAEELPAFPLYTHSSLIAMRPDLCELVIDGSSQNPLWNLEEFNYGEDCPSR